MSIIEYIYDLFLKNSNIGKQFEIPVHIKINENIEKMKVIVWAINLKEAETRAIRKITKQLKHPQSIDDKTLGIILQKKHYKPKGFFRSISSPIAVWRDPVYKNSLNNIFNSSNYKFGNLTKLSYKKIKSSTDSTDVNITKEYLIKSKKIAIISIFIWLGFLLFGIMFLALGFHPAYEQKFYIPWLNTYKCSGVFCLFIGIIAIIKIYKDLIWISLRLQNIDKSNCR